MKSILEILKRQRPSKSDEIRAALDSLPSDDGDAAIVALQARRRDALLDGLVGADIETIDRDLAAAVIERDRSRLFRRKLSDMLAEADTVEALQALSDRRVRIEASGRDLAKRFARFPELLGELADMLAADRDHHHECNIVDGLLAGAGLTVRVARAARPNFGIAETLIPTLVPTK